MMAMADAYRRAYGSSLWAWFRDRRLSGAVVYSLRVNSGNDSES